MRKALTAAAPIAVILAAAASTSACGQARGDDGPATSRNYQVGNFNQVEVAGPYDVQVRTGAAPSVSARGSQRTLDHLVVEVRGDRLVIHPEEHNGLFSFGWHRHGNAEVTVTVPQLQGATIAGSGDIHVDQVKGDRFEGQIAGSGGLTLGAIDVQQLKMSIAGSGDAKAASGRAQSVKYDIAGSGDIDARGVQADSADLSIAGSGNIFAQARTNANVEIMGSGDVEVTGGAKCNVSKQGSGSARCS
jgi:hypothetical protein